MKTFLVAAAILMPYMYFICSVYIICEKCRKDNYNKENDIVNSVQTLAESRMPWKLF